MMLGTILTQNEIMSRGLMRVHIKMMIIKEKVFLDCATRMIDCLSPVSEECKAEVQSMFCMDYLSSTNGSSASLLFQKPKD
jgi:hypothetical protein